MAYGDNSSGYSKGQSVFKGFSSRADNNNYKLYDFALIKQDLINRLSVRKGERVEKTVKIKKIIFFPRDAFL